MCAIFLFLHSTHSFDEITLHKKFYTLTHTPCSFANGQIQRPVNGEKTSKPNLLVLLRWTSSVHRLNLYWQWVSNRKRGKEKEAKNNNLPEWKLACVRVDMQKMGTCYSNGHYKLIEKIAFTSAHVPVNETFAPLSFIGIILLFVCRLVPTHIRAGLITLQLWIFVERVVPQDFHRLAMLCVCVCGALHLLSAFQLYD